MEICPVSCCEPRAENVYLELRPVSSTSMSRDRHHMTLLSAGRPRSEVNETNGSWAPGGGS